MVTKSTYTTYCLYSIGLIGLLTPVFSPVSASQDPSVTARLQALSTVTNPGVDQEFPRWAKPDANQDKKDLSYRVNTVLPFVGDRNKDKYLVYPKYGVVVPVLTANAADQALLNVGEAFDYYKYFANGAFNYYGFSPSQAASNMVIAAHSSFYADAEGRYKTIFQVVPMSEVGDAIRYYEKNATGSFDLYEYTIESSFETEKKNISVLDYANDGKSYITTYSCYPIGTNTKRWVNKAILVSTTYAQSSLTTVKQDIMLGSAPESSLNQAMQVAAKNETNVAENAPTKDTQSASSAGSPVNKIASKNVNATLIKVGVPEKKQVVKSRMTIAQKTALQQKVIDQYVLDFIKKNAGDSSKIVPKLKELSATLGKVSGKKRILSLQDKKMQRTISKYIKQYTRLSMKK